MARTRKTVKLAGSLLQWYRQARRDLPWRKHPTPYGIWISEMMLQQTRMEVVLPRYRRFLERFPNLEALASAGEDAVLAEWSGLGYYSRARALHAAARKMASENGGEFPRDLDAARALPGVGPYTAGAVLSIAYNLPLPVLDGNAIRVLTRLYRIGGDPRRGSTNRSLRDLAEQLIPPGKASQFNQALMELGALVCLPKKPRCGGCPLRNQCESLRRGDQNRYPERGKHRSTEAVFFSAAVLQVRAGFLLEQRGQDAPFLRGLWGFPLVEYQPSRGRGKLQKYLKTRWGIDTEPRELIVTFSHSITYRRITLRAYRFHLLGSLGRKKIDTESPRGGFFRLSQLGVQLPASSLDLKVKRVLLDIRG